MAEFNSQKSVLHCELVFEGAWPTSVAFLAGGRKIAGGTRDGFLLAGARRGDPRRDAPPPVRKLDAPTNGIPRLVATADGTTLISASLDKSVRLWDTSVEPTGSTEIVIDVEI